MAKKPRVFISFAIEDEKYRDLLVGQACNPRCPFDFVDMSLKQPFDEKWKTQCRQRIRGCHGVIGLISGHTMRAQGARWEINCAKEEGKPILGIYLRGRVQAPPEYDRVRKVEWDWDEIFRFINSLPES